MVVIKSATEIPCLLRFAKVRSAKLKGRGTALLSEPQPHVLRHENVPSPTHSTTLLERCWALFSRFYLWVDTRREGGVKRGPALSTPDALVPLAWSTACFRSCACSELKVTASERWLSVLALISCIAPTACSCLSLASAWIVQRWGYDEEGLANWIRFRYRTLWFGFFVREGGGGDAST